MVWYGTTYGILRLYQVYAILVVVLTTSMSSYGFVRCGYVWSSPVFSWRNVSLGQRYDETVLGYAGVRVSPGALYFARNF